MANELTRVYGTTKTLEANGAATNSGVTAVANDANYSVSADGSNYPDAEFVFSGTPDVAAAGYVILMAKPLDIDGTSDANWASVLIGSFAMDASSGLQYATITARDVPQVATYSIYNAWGNLAAGWTLKVKPRTVKPAA